MTRPRRRWLIVAAAVVTGGVFWWWNGEPPLNHDPRFVGLWELRQIGEYGEPDRSRIDFLDLLEDGSAEHHDVSRDEAGVSSCVWNAPYDRLEITNPNYMTLMDRLYNWWVQGIWFRYPPKRVVFQFNTVEWLDDGDVALIDSEGGRFRLQRLNGGESELYERSDEFLDAMPK